MQRSILFSATLRLFHRLCQYAFHLATTFEEINALLTSIQACSIFEKKMEQSSETFMPKTPFEKYVSSANVSSVQSPILNMIPTPDLLRLGRHYKTSDGIKSNFEERQSILIELFSRYKDGDAILYQIAYLQNAYSDLFRATLSKKPFVQYLKNAMQSPFSTTEHKLAIVSAWNGTPLNNNEEVIKLLKAKKTRLQRQIAQLDAEEEALLTDKIAAFSTLTGGKRLTRLKLIFSLLLNVESLKQNNYVDDILRQMSDTDVQELSDYLLQQLSAEKDIDYTPKIIAFILPKMGALVNIRAQILPLLENLAHDGIRKALINWLPALQHSYEQPFIDAVLMMLNGDQYSQSLGLTWLSELLPNTRAPDVQKILTILFDVFEEGNPHFAIISRAIDAITALIPRMTISDIEKYIDIILEKANDYRASYRADALQAAAKLLPMLTRASDIERFIQPILRGLNSDSFDELTMALDATTSLLSKVKVGEPIIQLFIEPILSVLTRDSLKGLRLYAASLETTAALLPKLEQNDQNIITIKILTDMCRSSQDEIWHANCANFLSHLIISNQTTEEFRQVLQNANGSNKAIVDLQKLMEQWQMIIANENKADMLPEIEEASIKPLGRP